VRGCGLWRGLDFQKEAREAIAPFKLATCMMILFGYASHGGSLLLLSHLEKSSKVTRECFESYLR
jgi:hypothetical protein